MITLWIDAHLSPALANWLSASFDVAAFALRGLGWRETKDEQTFEAAIDL